MKTYSMQDVENLPYHRTRENLVVVSREQLVHTLRRANLVAENVAEIATAVEPTAFSMHLREAGDPSGEAISDSVRRRIVEIAEAIADAEMADSTLWERHDWRETCDAAAARISAGHSAKFAEVIR
ncbi:MAG: hypothetical protein ACOZQL_10780 [Myxococcota bacterium]